jgi:FkbM family methyltransferase
MHNLKRIVQAIICRPSVGVLLAKLFSSQIPFKAGRCQVDINVMSSELVARIFFRCYESAEIRSIKFLEPTLHTIELGSSIGVVSALILQRLAVGKEPGITCVEANRAVSGLLERNLKRASPGKSFNILSRAVCYTGNSCHFESSRDTTIGKISNSNPGLGAIEVKAITLAQLLTEQKIDNYQLVMDIEGVEWDVLLQDSDALKKCQIMVVEIHPHPSKGGIAEFVEKMNSNGFKTRRIDGSVVTFDRKLGH